MLTIQLLLQPLCISLAIIGIGLIVIELRSDFDKSFSLFGIILVLLTAFCAPDLWNRAENTGKNWIEFQHIVICYFCPVVYQYLHALCRKKVSEHFRLFYSAAAILTVLFTSGTMFRQLGGTVKPSTLYYATFIPYFVFTIVLIFSFLITGLKTETRENAGILKWHFIGLVFLILSGCLDLVQLALSKRFFSEISSFSIYGTIGFGVLLTYLFSERLVVMVRERSIYINQLQNAYSELEKAKNLSEVGQSTAIINHEIKNYTSVISGYAQLIRDTVALSDKQASMVKGILNAATKLTGFSKDLLDFSKAKIVSDKQPLFITELVRSCINNFFHTRLESFTIIEEKKGEEITIHGNWGKLEQVFLNLFKNSFEAQARHITIRFVRSEWILLIALEDDGIGVSVEEFKDLFKAFKSNKRNGTGLGMATSRSIIESHGGHISVTSKNLHENQTSNGLIFTISFPVFEKKNVLRKKDSIILIESDLKELQSVVQILRNVCAVPYVFQNPEDLQSDKSNARMKVIGSANAISKVVNRGLQCYSLVPAPGNVMRFVGSPPDRREGIFNEEFVVSTLLAS
jgi:signal transduction histidine kinase